MYRRSIFAGLEQIVAKRELIDQEAADQPPTRPWKPLRAYQKGTDSMGPYVDWWNDYYFVRERNHHLVISNADESARHDWREFQRIKNEIWGPEVEAVELYPAESRLVDPSNAYYLWRNPKAAKLGIKRGRQIATPEMAVAPQRSFEPKKSPGDLEETGAESPKED